MWGPILSALGMMGGGAGAAGGLMGGMGAAGAAASSAPAMGGILGGLGAAGAGTAAAQPAATGILSPEMLKLLKSPEFKNMIGMMGQQGEEKRPVMYPQLMPPQTMPAPQGMFRPYSWAPRGMSFGGY